MVEGEEKFFGGEYSSPKSFLLFCMHPNLYSFCCQGFFTKKLITRDVEAPLQVARLIVTFLLAFLSGFVYTAFTVIFF